MADSDCLTPDLCVIGAGSGGLSVAAGAAQMGARVVLVERGAMGGDCLNAGCVPSKALLAAAHSAQHGRAADRFGVRFGPPNIDFAAVMAHVQAVIAGIAPHDSVARFEGLGVQVLQGTGHFVDARTISVAPNAGGPPIAVRARRMVIATGSRPALPPVPGLNSVPILTNESLFALTELPAHLLILGGGAIGCEMAQAFARLGGRVSLIERARLLAREDAELVAVARTALQCDGVTLYEETDITAVEAGTAGGVLLRVGDGRVLEGSHLLVAVGRRANVEALALAAAGIETTAQGVVTDARLRTSNRRVFAVGDVVAGAGQFTHLAAHHAGIVLRNTLFRLPARADRAPVPRVTYLDPEIAVVGLSEAEAIAARGADKVRVLRWPFAENDRARAELRTEGFVKAVVDARGNILGCAIAGARAGEVLQPWVLAMTNGLRIGALAGMIVPYPTFGEAGKRAAGRYFEPWLFGATVRWLVRFLAKFG
jgi:pyruvate/2-oxoglutarate dehydrogenase complex dihydrolipoamide dehydrogenase (E3) component